MTAAIADPATVTTVASKPVMTTRVWFAMDFAIEAMRSPRSPEISARRPESNALSSRRITRSRWSRSLRRATSPQPVGGRCCIDHHHRPLLRSRQLDDRARDQGCGTNKVLGCGYGGRLWLTVRAMDLGG